MSNNVNLKDLFQIDSLQLVETPEDPILLMDEIIILGLPEEFPTEDMANLLFHETRERGYQLPTMIWFQMVGDNGDKGVQLIFSKPVHQRLVSDSAMDSVDDVLRSAKIDDRCASYSMEFLTEGHFPAAVEYLRRTNPGGPLPSP